MLVCRKGFQFFGWEFSNLRKIRARLGLGQPAKGITFDRSPGIAGYHIRRSAAVRELATAWAACSERIF
jgi:hypothetical protein